MTKDQVYQLLIQAGFSPSEAQNFVGIAQAESGLRPNALNNTPSTGDYSVGLFQINFFENLGPARTARYAPRFGLPANTSTADFTKWLQQHPEAQADIAHDLFSSSGYSPWQGDAYVKANPGLLSQSPSHGRSTYDPGDSLGGSQYQAPPRPGNQDVGLLSGLTSLPGDIWSDGRGILGGAGDTFGALKGFFTAALWLIEPINWLRGFEILLGTVMLLLGLGYLGKADGTEDVAVGSLLKRGPKNVAGRGARGAGNAGRSAARESTTAKVIKTAPKAAVVAAAV